MISYYLRTGRRMLGGPRVRLPPSGTCDTGEACRRIGCGFLPSADSGFEFRPSDDPGFALWPSDNPGFASCPSAYPGFALWPSRAVFRLQTDRSRTLVSWMAETRTRSARSSPSMAAVRIRNVRLRLRWSKTEPGIRGSTSDGRNPSPGCGAAASNGKNPNLGCGCSSRWPKPEPKVRAETVRWAGGQRPRSGQWAATAQEAATAQRVVGRNRVVG